MTEIANEVAISFAHSQYDTTHIPITAALHHQASWYVTPAADLHQRLNRTGLAVDAEQNGLAWNEVFRFRRAGSTISGKRLLQSCPLRLNSRTRWPSLWTVSR